MGEPFGIVAGGGGLPGIVVAALASLGWQPVLVILPDAVDEWPSATGRRLRWGQTGDIFPFFQNQRVRHVVFCGSVSSRPDYRSMRPSLHTLRLLPKILRIVRGGDDHLLRAVSAAFEDRGLTLHAVHQIVPELLVPLGAVTRHGVENRDRAALDLGHRAAKRLGELDIGQAVVASAERVVALEGIEGTREMLIRVADLRTRGKLGRTERCVLVKAVKPQQDRRFDLPSIGTQTVQQAKDAGLVGIGLSAGSALLIGQDDVVAAADAAGLFIVGLEEDPSS